MAARKERLLPAQPDPVDSFMQDRLKHTEGELAEARKIYRENYWRELEHLRKRVEALEARAGGARPLTPGDIDYATDAGHQVERERIVAWLRGVATEHTDGSMDAVFGLAKDIEAKKHWEGT